ncbi:MAG: NAD-dependent epimerase/dehydratase family protein [candidate division KSB1 bacterium]|nr:NAD-dependent epimerase/dehydratase family protein [candidate division KSB1 bacterium]MDZ7273449.1 NAD-dependent epimerase/dehydratase family protein [candidate division KSB1 bacterium]MDZ7286959.1 NAD-dependent epimerase/dehydratase family protein [candidate division KSB1 bacterium]MDZ7299688.1 NAD-dependent epimerase/dehydratase family protein [candidate division KSB1 bacterium]MDZ7307952.1 NAD-dependent epimerase/dehydratase family protein [candidate division KSB1 bacterium]
MTKHIRKPGILVTGANGEMGHGLLGRLAELGTHHLIALDVHPLDENLKRLCSASITGDILEARLLERLQSEFEIHCVYHLAALLSTRAEFTPEAAHRVNVEGTLNLLKLAIEQSRWHGRVVKFMFPSSIAVYGLPSPAVKKAAGRVKEHEWTLPTTMYGCNKLYCEHLGRYYARHYRQLAADTLSGGIDFRALRFPGLISAVTVPSGGTSDYAPEMLHAAAQNKRYACFVREDVRIPFMAMPDAITALLRLEAAPRDSLTQTVYNVGSFNPSAGEIRQRVLREFKNAQIDFLPDDKRQAIVDSWPEDVDDSAARRDWGWTPAYDEERAFSEYLIPGIRERYRH